MCTKYCKRVYTVCTQYCVHMDVYTVCTQYCVYMDVYTVCTQYFVYMLMFQFEQINSMIALEQSLTDRTKKKFNPVM